MTAPRIHHRLNVRAVLILTATSLATALGVYVLWGYQERRVLGSALEQVKAFREAGEREEVPERRARDRDLALRHLNQYLTYRPHDADALEIQAQLLEAAGDTNGAVPVYERFLQVEPNGPRAVQARRRLSEAYVRQSDAIRMSPFAKLMPEEAAKQLRYVQAETLANQLLGPNARSSGVAAGSRQTGPEPRRARAEAYRLRGMAREGQLIPEKVTGAIEDYQEALKLDPGDLAAADRLARLYLNVKNDPAAAREVLDHLRDARPDALEVRKARYSFFAGIGDNQTADDDLRKALELAPGDVGLLVAAAGAALRPGTDAARRAARARLDEVPEASAHDPRVFWMRGVIALNGHDREEALRIWTEGLDQTGGTDALLTWHKANLLLELGRDAEAGVVVEQFRRIVGEENPMLRYLEGIQDEHAGRFSRAIDRLEWARARLDAGYQEAVRLALGRCQEKQGDRDEAEKTFRAALQLMPRSVMLRLALAQLLLARGSEGAAVEAVKELEEGLAAHPDQPGMLVLLTSARLRVQMMKPPERRNWADFDAAFAKAQAAAPNDADLPLLHAERLAASGGMDQALEFLAATVARNPKNMELAIRLAEALLRQGRSDQAMAVLDRASAPEAAGDRGALRIVRARLMTDQGRGREARAMLVQGVNTLPAVDQAAVLNYLVLLCVAQGDRDLTRAAYSEWARQRPDDARPKLALLELDIEANPRDRDAIRARIEALRPPSGRQDDPMWRLVQAWESLWKATQVDPDAPGMPASARMAQRKQRGELLKDADALVDGVLRDNKNDATALLLKGRILEAGGESERAAEFYARTWQRGHAEVLPHLVDLLTRLGQKGELARLRQADTTRQLDQIEALTFLRHGDKDEAERVVQESLRARPGMQPWQSAVLDVLGQGEQAESALRTATERQPDQLEPWLALLRHQATHGRRQAAEETIAAARRSVKTERPELLEAECRWATADWAGADRAFDAAVRRTPDARDVQLRASRYFVETGRPGRAEACLRSVLARNPGDRPVARELAVVLSADTERPDAWKPALELLGPEDPRTDTPEDRLARAIVLARSGDETRSKQALDLLQALVGDVPAESLVAGMARDMLARLLLAAKRPEEASRVAAVAAARSSSPAVIALYAEALLQSQQFAPLEQQLKRLAAIGSGRAYEANLRARMVLKQAGPGGAAVALEEAYRARENDPGAELFGREAFQQLLDLGPQALGDAERLGRRLSGHDPALSWMPALTRARQGHRDEALTLCRAAVEAGTNPVDLREAGRVALEVAVAPGGDPDTLRGSDEVLAAALGHAPEDDGLLMMKAMVSHLLGRFADEVRFYRDILKHQPRNTVALNNLAYALSEGLDQPSEALKVIDELIGQAGPDAEYLDTRGMILIRMGRIDQAVKDLEGAVQSAPLGIHLFHLARAYQRAGRTAEFRTTFERARQAGLTAATIDPNERDTFKALQKL